MKDPANKLILSGNAAGLDRIAHPIEGRRSRLPVAKQAPPRQFPTDSGKDIDTAQISKVFEGRFTEWSCQSLFLPSALTLWVPNLPLYQLFWVSYISFLSFCFSVISCGFYRNVLWFTTVCLRGFGRGLRSSHPASPIPPLYLYLSCLNHSYEAPLARYRSSVSDTILIIYLPISNVCSVIIVYAIR